MRSELELENAESESFVLLFLLGVAAKPLFPVKNK